jgi:ParB-like chromosome segregation protein Spo0J
MTDQFKTPIGAAAARKGKKAVDKKNVALERLEVMYVPVENVHYNAWNPNRQSQHDFDLLLASMREDGFTQPIVVVKHADLPGDYTIVDGEHRHRAAVTLGMDEVPVAVAPMTLEQAKIATLRHNRARGSEDIELTGALLRDLEALGALDWAADSLDLDDAELRLLLDDVPAPDLLAADEFGEAWEPDALLTGPAENAAVQADGQEMVTSSTPDAATALRIREQKIATAKTAEERRQIRADNDVYRVSLVFTGAEAVVVKRVLGDRPAVTILDLCRRADPDTTVADPPATVAAD